MYTVLEAIATGNPPLTRPQEEAAAFMQRIESLPGPLRRRIPMIYERSGIDRRYSCVADYGETEAAAFTFYPQDWSLEPAPTTAQRNQHYRRAVLPMAEGVARDVLQQVNFEPEEITHVIAVSCTGFFAPGLDIELVKRLGLPPSTQRTLIGFMGCYAAFNALRVAHSFCQSQPNAKVLIVCAELCTLHFQVDEAFETAVVNALFSDGAAAAIVSSRSAEEAVGHLAYIDNHVVLDDDSMEAMTWDIGNTGFLMGLSSKVPEIIAQSLPAYLEGLLCPNNLTLEQINFWAIHPGGRAIVEKARDVIGLKDEDIADSLDVLRQNGNMSSPTILFVLKRFLDRIKRGEKLQHGVAMAFGPGLTLEGCLWRRV